MLVEIIFTHSGHAHAIGNFAADDRARVHADLAAHLVQEAGCARYAAPPPQPEAPAEEPAPTKRARKPKPPSPEAAQ